MRYKLIGLLTFFALFISATIISINVADNDDTGVRYHEHIENASYIPCSEHNEDVFCTHLAIIDIDTNGQIIPGRDIADSITGQTIYRETTPDGKDEIVAKIKTIAKTGENHHLTDKADLESDAVIHVRGRSSRKFDKLGYSIDLIDEKGEDNDLEFLGMDAHSEWALHGPFLDKSLIRNYMWYNIGGEIMEYAPNCRFCEVFINGEYMGLYLAVEKITAGENRTRLNLKKNSKDNSFSGYMIKYDSPSETDVKNVVPLTDRIKILEKHMTVAYPKGLNISRELADEINKEFSQFEKALYSYDYDDDELGYRSYIDMQSFVDFFLINELTCNYDAGNRSTYFYKDLGGKYKTCIWDFDAACGNYIQETPETDFNLIHRPWFSQMILDEEYTEAIIKRYWELRETFFSEEYLMNYIDETVRYLGPAIDRNWGKWGYTFDETYLMLLPIERNLHSYDEAVTQMKDFLKRRIEWMDKNIDSIRRYSAESAVKYLNENAK